MVGVWSQLNVPAGCDSFYDVPQIGLWIRGIVPTAPFFFLAFMIILESYVTGTALISIALVKHALKHLSLLVCSCLEMCFWSNIASTILEDVLVSRC